MSDGLDQLSQMREQRKTRSVPPPRHPARMTPVEAPLAEDVQVSTPTIEPPPRQRPPALEPLTPGKNVGGAPAVDDLTKYSIYFDTSNDEFPEAVRAAGRHVKPKLDVSRSAVARLAVARMAETMKPEEVLAELRSRAPKQEDKVGRKRL